MWPGRFTGVPGAGASSVTVCFFAISKIASRISLLATSESPSTGIFSSSSASRFAQRLRSVSRFLSVSIFTCVIASFCVSTARLERKNLIRKKFSSTTMTIAVMLSRVFSRLFMFATRFISASP